MVQNQWNKLRAWQEARKSRKFPIERSAIACKLWYNLHESSTLRLGEWTKEEDTQRFDGWPRDKKTRNYAAEL